LGAALYSASCFAIAPTTQRMCVRLAQPPAFAGALLGAATVASLAASAPVAALARRCGYRWALVTGALLCFAGNLLYATAPQLGVNARAPAALLARALVGAGCAEPASRQYIASVVAPPRRVGAAASFVAADAVGMGLGPLLAAALAAALRSPDGDEKRRVHHHILALKVNHTRTGVETAPFDHPLGDFAFFLNVGITPRRFAAQKNALPPPARCALRSTARRPHRLFSGSAGWLARSTRSTSLRSPTSRSRPPRRRASPTSRVADTARLRTATPASGREPRAAR
jgi:MFS family permease